MFFYRSCYFFDQFCNLTLFKGDFCYTFINDFQKFILQEDFSHEKNSIPFTHRYSGVFVLWHDGGGADGHSNKSPYWQYKWDIGNLGLVAESGGWIYSYDYGKDPWLLIRTNAQNQQQTIVNNREITQNINVVGDWVYYMNSGGMGGLGIHKVKTDGTRKQLIVKHTRTNGFSAGMDNMIVQGDWIYFREGIIGNDGSSISSIYRVKTDGTGRTTLFKGVENFAIIGDRIFFKTSMETNNVLYTAKTDGTGRKKLSNDRVWGIIVSDGNWIYYADNNMTLYRIKSDGTGKTVIADGVWSNCFNVDGDLIYYKSFNDQKLYRMKTDGTNKKMIVNDTDAHNIHITKDWLYYNTSVKVINSAGGDSYPQRIKRIARSKIDK